MSYEKELDYAVQLARGAGRIVLDHFGRVERLTKRQAEAVTIADRASQRYIVAELKKRYAADGVIGEENDTGDAITFECPDPLGRVWVIDPIDGTNNFVAGLQTFAVCIGLLDKGMPVMGVVYDVCRNQMYKAAKGAGAWLDDRRIQASRAPMDNSSVLMVTANLLDKTGRLPQYAVRWVGQTTWKVRCIGSAALEASLVAAGVAHGAITVNGKLWDVAAPAAILAEADASLTDLSGKDIFPFDLAHYDGAKVPFLATAPEAKDVLLAEIRNYP